MSYARTVSATSTGALDHVTIVTDDFGASRAVYDAVLGALGVTHWVEYEDPEEEDDDPGTVAAVGYAVSGQPAHFWLVAGLPPTTGGHVAFGAGTPELVDAAHRAATAAGASVVQAPRRWEAAQLAYYGTQVRDPKGNLIEVVHRPA